MARKVQSENAKASTTKAKAKAVVGARSKAVKPASKKRPEGRPTKYDPAWAAILPDMFKQGQSVIEVAVELGISKTAYYEYEAAYPEFADASTRGKQISQAWWEQQGREGLYDTTDYDEKGRPTCRRSLNSSVWAKNVSCRFRADWTDRHELTGADGGPIGVDAMTHDEVLARLAELRAKQDA